MKPLKISSTACEEGRLKVNLLSEEGDAFQLSLLPDEVISFLSIINDSLAEVVGRPFDDTDHSCGESPRAKN